MPALTEAKPLIMGTRSILAWQRGAKTQTRRLVKPPPDADDWQPFWCSHSIAEESHWSWHRQAKDGFFLYPMRQPYAVGDLLWIREALVRWHGWVAYDAGHNYADGAPDDPDHHLLVRWPSKRWKRDKLPSIFMPRWACRYYARVVSVRSEPLQDISAQDAIAEGTLVGTRYSEPILVNFYHGTHHLLYWEWWDSMHKKRGTRSEDNPWVWVYGLEKADGQD